MLIIGNRKGRNDFVVPSPFLIERLTPLQGEMHMKKGSSISGLTVITIDNIHEKCKCRDNGAKVRFRENPAIHDCASDAGLDDCQASAHESIQESTLWFNNEDYATMKERDRILVRMAREERVSEGDSMLHNHTLRGLESRLSNGLSRKDHSIEAVLMEQSQQWFAGQSNPDRIAKIYGKITAKAKARARFMGESDARTVQDIYGHKVNTKKHLPNGDGESDTTDRTADESSSFSWSPLLEWHLPLNSVNGDDGTVIMPSVRRPPRKNHRRHSLMTSTIESSTITTSMQGRRRSVNWFGVPRLISGTSSNILMTTTPPKKRQPRAGPLLGDASTETIQSSIVLSDSPSDKSPSLPKRGIMRSWSSSQTLSSFRKKSILATR